MVITNYNVTQDNIEKLQSLKVCWLLEPILLFNYKIQKGLGQ